MIKLKIITSTKDLKAAVAKVLPAVPAKPQTPIQSAILFKAEGDKLELQANNFSTAIKAVIAAEVEEAGEVAISGKNVAAVVAKLEGGIVTIEEEDGMAIIKSDATKFELFTTEADDFAKFEFAAPDFNLMLPVETLRNLIGKTTFSAAEEKDGRPIFQGVNFIFKPTEITAVATNTHRLAVVKATADLPELDGEKSLIIPANVLDDFARIAPDKGNLDFQANNRAVLFKFNDFEITTRLIDGNFPPFDRLLNAEICGTATVIKNDLKAALTRTDIISRQSEYNTVKLKFDSEGLELSATSFETGRVVEHVLADVEGSIDIAFNTTYISDFAKVADCADITFEFGADSLTPIRMRGNDDKDFVYVVTPVRTE